MTMTELTGRRWHRERGAGGGSLAWTLLWPVMLLLILGGIQVAVHSYARSLALSAAQAGARAAAAYPTSTDRGRQAAEAFLHNRSAANVTDPQVTVTLAGDSVAVIVSGSSPSLIPGVTFTLAERAAAPLETGAQP